MASVILDHWSAIELFCRIISVYKNIPINYFDNDLIKDYLNQAVKPVFYEDVQASINQKIKDNNYTIVKKRRKKKKSNAPSEESTEIGVLTTKPIYDISNQIRKGVPIVIESNVFKAFQFYINNYKIATLPHFDFTTEIEKKTIQRHLEGTIWYIYYHDQFEALNNSNDEQVFHSIGRGIVRFEQFLNINIHSLDAQTKRPVSHVGRYSTNIGEAQLHARLKTTSGKHDLSIMLHLGAEIPELAIGQYRNMHESDSKIFSGDILLLRVKEEDIESNLLQPKLFLRDNSEDWEELDDFIRIFLGSDRSEIVTPTGIRNIEALKTWLNKRESNIYSNYSKQFSKNLQFVHDEDKIEAFRKKFYLYYSTKSNRDEEEDGVGVLFWNCTELDFSKKIEEGKLQCIASILNKNRDNEHKEFEAEMIRVHDKDPVIIIERRKNSSEPITICVLAPMTVTYKQSINFGFCFHDDWSGDLRLSPLILSTKRLFGEKRIGKLSHEQAIKAQKKWNTGFFEHKEKFAIFEQYSNTSEESS